MATAPTNKPVAPSYNSPVYQPQALYCIVGLACLAGFLVDLAVLSFPPSFGSVEWRIAFLQQISDRGINFAIWSSATFIWHSSIAFLA